MSPLNIAIVGAGPSGLTLANLLVSKDINVTIFERDVSPTSRPTKGGTLDLHVDTGLAAIEAAGLHDAFYAIARSDIASSVSVFADREGNAHMTMSGGADEGNTRPEIDRDDLRKLLLEALPDTLTVRWGSRITSVTPDGTLVFSDGTEEPTSGKYDLVIGAEGTWSKVRAHITDTQPVFSGSSGFELQIPNPKLYPEIDQKIGNGIFFTMGAELSLTGQRLGTGAIMIYAFKRSDGPNDLQNIIDGCGGDLLKVKDEIMKLYADAGWSPDILEWIKVADPQTLRAWPLYEYSLPDGHVFVHKRGWTVIGDAAHVMTPFAGEGVNAAMRDSLELAKHIKEAVGVDEASRSEALDKAVEEYEKAMFERSREVMEETMRNKHAFLDKDAPHPMIEAFKQMMSAAGGEVPRSHEPSR
ncbi:hypothetical protein H0H93_006831 [Arthromyces matolae]|nr:hypothetical protein H0H93_006831 [Arthromyces matolae]